MTYLWACARCGCVGFHSEACIAATAGEKAYERGYADGLAAGRAPAPSEPGYRERLARAIHESRITVAKHGDFTDRCICNSIAASIERGMAGMVPRPDPEKVIAEWTAALAPSEPHGHPQEVCEPCWKAGYDAAPAPSEPGLASAALRMVRRYEEALGIFDEEIAALRAALLAAPAPSEPCRVEPAFSQHEYAVAYCETHDQPADQCVPAPSERLTPEPIGSDPDNEVEAGDWFAADDAPAPSEPGLPPVESYHGHDSYYEGCDECAAALAPAPSEPGLDVNELVVAFSGAVRRVALAKGIRPTEFLEAIRAEYARARLGDG